MILSWNWRLNQTHIYKASLGILSESQDSTPPEPRTCSSAKVQYSECTQATRTPVPSPKDWHWPCISPLATLRSKLEQPPTFSLKIRSFVWVIYCMLFFFFLVENIAFFQGFRIFTFFLSFAAKALYWWGIVPRPDSICRYLEGKRGEEENFLNLSLLTHILQVQFECPWICGMEIPLPNMSIIRLCAD